MITMYLGGLADYNIQGFGRQIASFSERGHFIAG
jgi:hypothetical protein